MSFNYVPGQTVTVPEIEYKQTVKLAAGKTAVVVVDMQNDFVKPDGTLVVESAAGTIPNIRALLNAARSAKIPIAYTQDTHFDGDPEWEIWPEHCKKNTWGWQIIDELKPHATDLVVEKSRYDGFYGTSLEHFLSRVWKVENLIIVGTVSSICVAHTAASAGLRWFNVTVPANGISALTEFDQALTLRQVSWLYLGDVVHSVSDIQFVK
ncbi:MAG TPA: isochorismatase family cysteine hydrolase [Calditrichia bacterium]|nr:cysteine hydrolase [Calditrichota bacterium]HQU73839.1 isochorismatase family cysteine hydrolase [Calditrichia bacterium]HQV33919.1 isochorismatase family cysteine hydrolase [Calditrichia bacterium]